jgi:hypothetical protein
MSRDCWLKNFKTKAMAESQKLIIKTVHLLSSSLTHHPCDKQTQCSMADWTVWEKMTILLTKIWTLMSKLLVEDAETIRYPATKDPSQRLTGEVSQMQIRI